MGLLLLVMLLGAGCAARQISAPTLPLTYVRIGLCEDYPEETRTLENARADLWLMKTNGFSVLRVALGWDGIEPRRGEFDWHFWDAYFAIANELGVELIPYICYTPDWAARTNQEAWKQPPRDVADFGRFVEQVVTRYRGKVRSWEIWNEPDNQAYWAGTPEEFAELLRAGCVAVRKADPNARIVSGGIAWDISFVEKLLEQPGALDLVDVVNMHNYYETWSSDPVEDIDDYVARMRRMLLRAGLDKELWLAEVGYSSFRPGQKISETYTATYPYEHTPEFQAASVFRMLVPILASSSVSTFAWYRINDLPATEDIIGDANNRHLGVVTTNRTAKPALDAVRFAARLFGDGVSPADSSVRISKTLGSEAETHAFVNARGELLVITWLKIITPHTPFTAAGDAEDSREETLKLEIPPEFALPPRVFNARGHELNTRIHRSKRSVEFQLRGGEVLVLVMPRK